MDIQERIAELIRNNGLSLEEARTVAEAEAKQGADFLNHALKPTTRESPRVRAARIARQQAEELLKELGNQCKDAKQTMEQSIQAYAAALLQSMKLSKALDEEESAKKAQTQ